jgi:hypothetical protein
MVTTLHKVWDTYITLHPDAEMLPQPGGDCGFFIQ